MSDKRTHIAFPLSDGMTPLDFMHHGLQPNRLPVVCNSVA
jgi:hypothetical protein